MSKLWTGFNLKYQKCHGKAMGPKLFGGITGNTIDDSNLSAHLVSRHHPSVKAVHELDEIRQYLVQSFQY